MNLFSHFFVLADSIVGSRFLLVFALIIVIFGLIATGIYLYIHFKDKKIKEKIKFELNTENALVIDYLNKKAKVVNFKKLDEVSEISYEEFIKHFYQKDSDNFDKWVKNLLSGQVLADSEDTVKTFNFSRGKFEKKDVLKCTFKLLLCCNKINKTKKILYFNTHFLYNLPVAQTIENEAGIKDVYSIKDINRLYMQNKFKYGSMYLVKFYKKNNIPSSYNEYEIRYLLLNAIYGEQKAKKVSHHLSYYVFSDNEPLEAVIIRFRSSELGINSRSISTYGKITNEAKKQIKKVDYLLEAKGLVTFYDYVISAGQINKLDKDFLKSVDMLTRLNKLAKEGNQKFLVYKDEFGSNQNIEDSYKAEVSKIIRLNLLNVNFLPIYRIANIRVMNPGFIALVEPRQTIFKNIYEVKQYALKYNLNKELYSLIIRDVVPVFNDEKENLTTKLALFISLNEIEFMVRNFPHMSGIDNLNLILILNNNDLISIDNDKESDNIKQTFMTHIGLLKERGYEIYLNISVGDFILREKTYTIFDGFFINSHLPANFKLEGKKIQDTYALYNKMSKFGKPIVSYRTHSWQEIELLVKKGIYTFATNVISEPSSMLIPIKKKVSKKLANMYKK